MHIRQWSKKGGMHTETPCRNGEALLWWQGKNILPCALLHVRRGFVPTVALVAAGKNILPCALLHVRRGFAATVALVAAGRILCPVHCCCSSAEASL